MFSYLCLFKFNSRYFILNLLQHKRDGDDSDHNFEFTGGNVQLITTEESWEQKISEAKRDGRIVSTRHIVIFFIKFCLEKTLDSCALFNKF